MERVLWVETPLTHSGAVDFDAFRKRLWFRWQALVPAAAVVILFLLALFPRITEHPGDKITSNRVEEPGIDLKQNDSATPTSENDADKPPKARKLEAVVDRHVQEPLPRQDVFPSAGLSNQESLRLTYAQSVSSANMIASVGDSESHPIQINKLDTPEIEISKLEIEPIKIEPLP
jgi:hypothetical protein